MSDPTEPTVDREQIRLRSEPGSGGTWSSVFPASPSVPDSTEQRWELCTRDDCPIPLHEHQGVGTRFTQHPTPSVSVPTPTPTERTLAQRVMDEATMEVGVSLFGKVTTRSELAVLAVVAALRVVAEHAPDFTGAEILALADEIERTP